MKVVISRTTNYDDDRPCEGVERDRKHKEWVGHIEDLWEFARKYKRIVVLAPETEYSDEDLFEVEIYDGLAGRQVDVGRSSCASRQGGVMSEHEWMNPERVNEETRDEVKSELKAPWSTMRT